MTLLPRLCDLEQITDGCIPNLDREPAVDNNRGAQSIESRISQCPILVILKESGRIP